MPLFGPWRAQLFWVEPVPASAHPCFTERETEAVDSQNRLSLPLPGDPPCLSMLCSLLGQSGSRDPKGTQGGGKPGTRRGRERHRRAWASDLGSGSLGPLVVPSPQPPSPPLPVSPKAGRSRCPSSCPRSPEAPGVGHAAAVLEGGGPGHRSRPREDGGFRGRPPEEGRKGASDAHHVCGIEYD